MNNPHKLPPLPDMKLHRKEVMELLTEEMYGRPGKYKFEADASEAVFLAGLDIEMLREYRKREYHYLKNRRPEMYGTIAGNR